MTTAMTRGQRVLRLLKWAGIGLAIGSGVALWIVVVNAVGN